MREELVRIVNTSSSSEFSDQPLSTSWTELSKDQVEKLLSRVDRNRIENSEININPPHTKIYVRRNLEKQYEFRVEVRE
jgi:hypothetical protein